MLTKNMLNDQIWSIRLICCYLQYNCMTYDDNIERANEKFIQISKKYKLNPALLKDIMLLRNKGYNNIQIAEQTGINKNTINKYVAALGEMENNDLMTLLATIAIITAGVYLLAKFFEALNNE